MGCPLCNPTNENVIFQNDFVRVILVDEIPGYVRVITQKHVKKFSDLSDDEAVNLTMLVKKIEKIIIQTLKPDKVNIASLGNMVPHMHVHIIPRFKNDPWWPGATFCEKQRDFNYPVTSEDIQNLTNKIKALNE
jgi:diadenosine tetraphosphate (Ap4A) HIT family hydrolase